MAPSTAAGKRICSTMKETTIAQEKKFRDSKRLVIGKYPEAAQRARKKPVCASTPRPVARRASRASPSRCVARKAR